MTLVTRQGSVVDNNDGSYTFVNVVALDADDDSQPFRPPAGTRAMSFQAVGTFDSATIALQGSNDGVTYAALPTAMAHTVAGMKSVAAIDLGFKYYRLLNTGGGASTALFGFVHILAAR